MAEQVPFHFLQGDRAGIEEIAHDGVVEDVDQHDQVQKAGDPAHQVGEAVKEFFQLQEHRVPCIVVVGLPA